MARDGIEHAVDVPAAARRAVQLRKVDVFVDGHRHRDVRECEHLGDGDLHDDDIHVGQPGEIPVAARLAHVMLVVVGIEDRSPEELDGKVPVLLVPVLRQQLLVLPVGGVEAFDGLDDEGVHHLLVVVPVEALLLQHGIQVGILLDERAVDPAPHLPVGLVRVLLVLHVFLVDGALLYLVAELAHRLHVVFPAAFLVFHEEVELLVRLQLDGEPVVCETARGSLRPLAGGTGGGDFHTVPLLLRDRYNQSQEVIIEVVRLRQAEKQFLLSVVHIPVAVLIVCVG